MSRFGLTLYGTFLDAAWPREEDAEVELITWRDVAKLFFDSSAPVQALAEKAGHVWDEKAIEEVDAKLLDMAERGEFVGALSMGPEAVEEIWRRWSYAIIAAELESRFGEELNIPMPRAAPPEVKGAAVMLYILGGPAKDYRRELYDKKKKH